jgi:hypothetical protein
VATVDPTGDSFTLTEHSGTVVSVQGTAASGTVTAKSVFIGLGDGRGRNHGWGGRPAPTSTS